MRVFTATLAVLLLTAICSLAQADLRVSRNAELSRNETKPSFCCFTSISHPIPHSMIRSAYRTSSICPMQAVVLVTRNGQKVCANPKAHWLQKYLKHLGLLED
ncbi:CCL4 protein, partial [Donacobius atricapilla]|nr:CCL4 protein [Donacobius atricapilla]